MEPSETAEAAERHTADGAGFEPHHRTLMEPSETAEAAEAAEAAGMKRKDLIALLSVAALVTACVKGNPPPAAQKDNSQGPVFPLTSGSVVIPLFPDRASGPNLTVSLETADVSGLSAPLRDLVCAALYDGMDGAAYREQVVRRETAGYYEAAKDFLEGGGSFEDYGGSWDWAYDETVPSQSLLFGHILVIERTRYAFTGGAHGNYTVDCAVADTEKRRILTLADVVARDALPKTRRLTEAALRERLDIGPEAPLSEGGLFEDAVDLPENFFLTEEGLGFLWNPYEIGPYVMGAIEVVIPYEKLAGCLLLY
ncbi:MAG: RsiV family protein [Spirochaetaceae bacterium]|jgi:hypothetical protein|nr:RsiV family protein [Spirochaetaceae bacterium]